MLLESELTAVMPTVRNVTPQDLVASILVSIPATTLGF